MLKDAYEKLTETLNSISGAMHPFKRLYEHVKMYASAKDSPDDKNGLFVELQTVVELSKNLYSFDLKTKYYIS